MHQRNLPENNRYDLETTRVPGSLSLFSIQRPPVNGGYVYLGDGITAVLSSEFPQHEGTVHVEAVIPKNIIRDLILQASVFTAMTKETSI